MSLNGIAEVGVLDDADDVANSLCVVAACLRSEVKLLSGLMQ